MKIMKIDQITIQNYRGIRDKQIIPINNFSSIVGKNDSGKSIVINAIASFLDPKTYKLVESDFNNINSEVTIECRFHDENIREILTNKIKSKIKKTDGLDELLNDIIFDNKIFIQKSSLNPKDNFSSIMYLQQEYVDDDFKNLYSKSDDELKTILEKYSIVIPISGSGRNSKMEKVKQIKAYCNNNSIDREDIWVEDLYKISDLLPAVELFVSDYALEADSKFKTTSVSEIRGFFNEETSGDTKRLSEIEKDIQSAMYKEAESIKTFMRDYASNLQEVVITPEIVWSKAIDGVSVKFRFDGDAVPILMSHKGAGYRRLFMVARFRYLAEKNKGSNVIYLIEEPETFLHPSAQQDLLDALKRLSDDNQVIITTHSPVFAGSTEENSIVLCLKDSQSKYKVAQDGNKDEFIQQIIEELGIKPYYNLRDSFEKIVFVEGKDDVYFYNKLSEVFLKKQLNGNSKILVLPFGGSSINSIVNIEYFSKQGRPMFLLLDSDKGLRIKQPCQINKQQKTFDEFNSKQKSKAYLLNKSTIENYFHSRAVERYLGLDNLSISDFKDDDNMDDVIKDINNKHSTRLSKKNNLKIFEIMSLEEFSDIVEQELIDFLGEIVNNEK